MYDNMYLDTNHIYLNMGISNIAIIPKTFPVRDLQRRYADILDLVKSEKSPVLLLNKSRPEAIIMDVETYNSLASDNYIYDEDYILKIDKKALAEHKAKKTKKLRSLRDLV